MHHFSFSTKGHPVNFLASGTMLYFNRVSVRCARFSGQASGLSGDTFDSAVFENCDALLWVWRTV